MRFARLALAVITVLCTAPAAARPLQTSDIHRLVDVERPAISPDGNLVAFLVSRSTADRNGYRGALVLETIAAGTQRTIHAGDVGAPAWSPDGAYLSYLASDGHGSMQVVLRDRTGRTRAVTAAPNGVTDFVWSPDGSRIAFVAADNLPKTVGFVVHDNDYTVSGAIAPLHLWVTGLSGAAKQVTRGSWTLPPVDAGGTYSHQVAWSSDGRTLLFTRVATTASGHDEDSTIEALDLRTRAMHPWVGHPKFEVSPSISPDGTHATYWYPRDDQYLGENEIFLTTPAGGVGRDLTRPLDRNVGGTLWMPDGKSLLMCGNDGFNRVAWLQPLSGPARLLSLNGLQLSCEPYGDGTFDSGIDASVARDGALAFIATDTGHAREIYYLSSPDAVPHRLTHYNDFVGKLAIGRMHGLDWQGPDDFREDGVLTYPPRMRSGKRYPLVVLIHGGPAEMSALSFVEGSFWPRAQLIAARGFVVLEPNYRGSDGLGQAYMLGVAGNTVVGPAADIMAGVAAAEKDRAVDPARLGVSGWSYGGLMTSWLITQQHVWKAAVSGAAVDDEIAEYDLSTSNVQNAYYLGGSPYKDDFERVYREQSPITFAQNVTTPTLIWATTGDPVCPIPQSYAFYHALRDNHVTVKFIAYQAATHGPSTPAMTEDLTAQWLAWFDRFLK